MSFSTNHTFVGLLAGMNTHMYVESARSSPAGAANVAENRILWHQSCA